MAVGGDLVVSERLLSVMWPRRAARARISVWITRASTVASGSLSRDAVARTQRSAVPESARALDCPRMTIWFTGESAVRASARFA